jgi:preprotein translocase subunit YajC
MNWVGVAQAMGIGGQQGAQGGGWGAMVPLILMFVIFYFLLIRPQQTKQKKHRQMLGTLKKGDMIITSGGLHGKITGLTDTAITLEIAERVRVKVSRGYIAGLVSSSSELEPKKQ